MLVEEEIKGEIQRQTLPVSLKDSGVEKKNASSIPLLEV